MSRQYSSRTISDLAKKLGKHTEAPHRDRLRTLEQAAKITTVPITRALLALQQLEREGRSVNVAGLHKTLGHKVSAPMPPSSNGRGHSVPTPSEGPERERLHEAFKMPTAFSGVDDPTSLRDQANREFETPRWWFGGRSLGVYGADLRRRGLLVSYLIRELMHNGYRTIAPMRAPSKADQRMLAPSAEVVDLTRLPGGIRQLHEELEERTTAGETLVVLVDPRHGLDEDDLSVLVELLYLPLPSLRVLYAESFVVRGWSEFMDAMLTYGESMLLGPARAADLEAFGLPADYEMPTDPGAGIYLVDGGYTVRFGAPQRVSTYSSAHQANNRWGPCGHRPKASLGSLPVGAAEGRRSALLGRQGRPWMEDGRRDGDPCHRCVLAGRPRLGVRGAGGIRAAAPPDHLLPARPPGGPPVLLQAHHQRDDRSPVRRRGRRGREGGASPVHRRRRPARPALGRAQRAHHLVRRVLIDDVQRAPGDYLDPGAHHHTVRLGGAQRQKGCPGMARID